ncbi:uncharacterized protein LOC106529437 isoform X2 [Austrofundulus limnaeus]|uniref:Uncharacterized protein LOC106529437 isoform X2 n=1 Tax=Austrofundulus limnaeus TaxID=52670 RepID=A0A2I4CK00_AUSLI|nr:PREDICTED: uncharacterized protein LOC106529437 isoform X2 [Austrofundulus limnaeus]
MEVRKQRSSDDDEELQEENDTVVFGVSPEAPAESRDELQVSDTEHEEKRRCDALISACQNNMSEVVQELLRTAADVTCCNHLQQTALHLSPPELQVKMLRWMWRPHLAPQAQLLQAAWQGDSARVGHLLTQEERVDVNLPNEAGVTAVMLAVRDVDLFEGLTKWLPWEHRPVEVIRKLLESSADLSVRDHRGCSVLHYAENICSRHREEIVWILTDALDADPTFDLFQDLDSQLDLDTERDDDQRTPVTQRDLLCSHTEVKQSEQQDKMFYCCKSF